jgi:ApbE superfamily uncharacterized protein (UPF0280 family)
VSWQETPTAHLSPDGHLRLVHGPIDLIVTAEGSAQAARAAYHRARDAFQPVLTDLVSDLPHLRQSEGPMLTGAIAQKMQQAVRPFAPTFVTPMAAVAGAVADHILKAMLTPDHGLSRAHVNNGGDIALWTADQPLNLAICEDPVTAAPGAQARIGPHDGIGGVATSGWRGRSYSLGIADAVTVLARTAAMADVAATLIANAIDLPGHPAITRAPANSLSPDSDLGARLVTTNVTSLPAHDLHTALDRGAAVACDFAARDLIAGACLASQGQRRMVGITLTARDARDQIQPKELTHA